MATDDIQPYKFKKGKSGNPAGRPVGARSRETIVRKWLEAIKESRNPITGELERLPIADQIVLSLIGKALKGDVSAFKELMDSGYGKLTDKVEHSGDIITGIQINVKRNDSGD